MPDANERISISLPVPSVAMKVFIEKCLRDDEFFIRALENPIRALKNTGLKPDEQNLTSESFTNFFGAISRLKELIKEKQYKEITFEGIFGKPAEIYGSTIRTMISHGYDKEWDNRDAFLDRQSSYTTHKNFFAELKRNANIELVKSVSLKRNIELNKMVKKNMQIEIKKAISSMRPAEVEINMAAEYSKKAETAAGANKEWGLAQAHTEKRSEEYHDTKFENNGIGIDDFEDIIHGPLVNPKELEIIAARIDVFTKIAKDNKPK